MSFDVRVITSRELNIAAATAHFIVTGIRVAS